MRTLLLLAFLITTLSIQQALSKKCSSNPAKIECSAKEYQNYVDCVRGRMKRSADCYDDDEEECSSGQCGNSCDSCNCEECTASDCGSSCNKRCCSSCCEFRECSTNHCCHKLCHSSCSTSSCRSSCRRSCYKSVRREKERDIVSPGSLKLSSNTSNSVSNRGVHNITTVIHLNNLINNTNLIDVPINLNNSNVNNITVENAQNGSSVYGAASNSASNSPCCNVIEPRQCVPTASYPYINCFHLRRQQCGQFCRSPVVHKVAQNVCYNSGNKNPVCGQQVIYVPQPQSSCNYQPQWPFVTCNNPGGNCNGCYDYLLNPFRTQRTCGSSCYNYGINQGMVFRQGPVLGPGYQLPLPMNPMMPTGCNSYGGCGLTNMANYINPGMYYGMNTYNNYGIYGSFTPQGIPSYGGNIGMPIQGYGDNLMAALGGANMGNYPLPMEEFVPLNFTSVNDTNLLYGLIQNNSSPLTSIGGMPENMFGQAITIDEETFKKLLGKDVLNEKEEEPVNKDVKTETLPPEENETTTVFSSLFG